jgi:3-phenylpropionate/cinnamic acid dioxygenase small subunit
MKAAIDPQSYLELSQLLADYAAIVDAADWDAWCELFTDDCGNCHNLHRFQNETYALKMKRALAVSIEIVRTFRLPRVTRARVPDHPVIRFGIAMARDAVSFGEAARL